MHTNLQAAAALCCEVTAYSAVGWQADVQRLGFRVGSEGVLLKAAAGRRLEVPHTTPPDRDAGEARRKNAV